MQEPITKPQLLTGLMIPSAQRINRMEHKLSNIQSSNTQLLQVVTTYNGIVLQPRPLLETAFMGTVVKPATITIGINRVKSSYTKRDTITIGLIELHKKSPESIELSKSSFVYYDITKTDSTINAVLAASETYPIQESGIVRQVLGFAKFNDEETQIVKWDQHHYGNIHIHGRFS